MEKFLHHGSVEMLPLRGLIRFLCRGSIKKFLHRGSVKRDQYRGSMEDCADPFLGIEHHNRLLEQKKRSSYTVKMWKRSYIVEAWTIALIRCWVSSTIMIPAPWKRGEIPTLWKCKKGHILWKHG